ncbi:uncharacterized protein BX664DRAFT_291258 [Halteromyces radiatus]|uniref:uncharacterized protein n=1 Tax=Halteromyces radiatus TaxID=101107 RepID=UPI002220F736|nr:uncharacterized protein BX664DRAFT_291258 [Halteromyces radiatus]KAI8096396.1 hypothetical protein BX664DRAFT_291258 [Halteromyces radiatus]
METDRRKQDTQTHTFDYITREETMTDTPTQDDTFTPPSPLPTTTTTPITTTTTMTTTATLQNYHLTLTKSFDQQQQQQDDAIDDIFETKSTLLMEQMASLHGQLGHMLPTRSYYSGSAVPPSTLSDVGSHPSVVSSSCSSSLSSCSLQHQQHTTTTTTTTTNTTTPSSLTGGEWEDGCSSSASQSDIILLHPLQAAQEDMALYESNLATMRTQMNLIKDGMQWIQENYTNYCSIPSSDDCTDTTTATTTTTNDLTLSSTIGGNGVLNVSQQRQLARLSQMDQAYGTLQFRMAQAEDQYKAFRQGFDFSQACHAVRIALDSVQANMMQQRTMMTANHHQELVQAWEESITNTTKQLASLRQDYQDYFMSSSTSSSPLLLQQQQQEEDTGLEDNHEELKDGQQLQQQQQQQRRLYQQRWEKMNEKNELVRTWVEEVRVWFAEAERIRQWIDERRDQLEETTLPDPLAPHLSQYDNDDDISGLEKVKQWQEQHQLLENDMETFDKQDMARLRSHVKALTGGKDLSPADTTTIEITLTTLTTLDKIMHTLREKSHRLHLLTQRALWEAEFAKTMEWLHDTENQVDTFLGQARWTDQSDMDKSVLIDGLLALEHKMSDFDKGGFTTTINLFQDFDDAAEEDLPAHLEQRQSNCEQFFEDLYKRMVFVRSVVEQRLALMDFMDMVQHVHADAHQLQLDLQQTCSFSEHVMTTDDNDLDEVMWADRVQAMQERIIPLASSQRIPYPAATLTVDQQDNEHANQVIRQHVSHYRTQLVLLGEAVDGHYQAMKQRWQLQRRTKTLAAEAEQWTLWADERSSLIQQNQQQLLLQGQSLGLDQVAHWERMLATTKTKLEGKEIQANEVLLKAKQVTGTLQELIPDTIITESEEIKTLNGAIQEMNSAYETLRQNMNNHEQSLQQWRTKLEQGHNVVDMLNELVQFIRNLRVSLPGIKHQCGFMTGQSQQQDQERFDTLTKTWIKMKQDVEDRQSLFDRLQLDDSLKKDELILEWNSLMKDMDQLADFNDTVQQWFDRQRRLSLVEQALAHATNNEEKEDDDDGLERMIQSVQEQQEVLKVIGQDIIQAADTRDPLQTANYSCARDRHQSLVARAQQLMMDAQIKQQQKRHLLACQQHQQKLDELVATIMTSEKNIKERVAQYWCQGWDLVINQQVDALATLVCTTNQNIMDVQTQKDHFHRRWEHLQHLTPTKLSDDSNEHPFFSSSSVEKALQQLDQAIGTEKRQLVLQRHLHIHAKAAQDLQNWLSQCSTALGQLTLDIGVADESDMRASIGRFEAKLDGMQSTMTEFGRIHDKVMMMMFENNDNDDDRKSKVQIIYDKLQDDYHQLGKQLEDISLATDRHRQHVNIARKMKDLLYMIGGYRVRVERIRIQSDATQHNDDGGDDGDDILSSWLLECPLTMIPTEQAIEATNTELDRLEQEIQLHLPSALGDLDELLLEHADDMFTDQRNEITQAIAGLTQGIQNKHYWLAEARKLETILTVLDEWEVLLSALAEVVDRASLPMEISTTTTTTTTTTSRNTQQRQQQQQKRRADLQAMLIDLDTRYRYYEPNIQALVKEAQLVMMQGEQKQDARLLAYHDQLTEQWRQLQQLAEAKRQALLANIGPLADPLVLSSLHDALPGGHQRRPMTTMSSITTTRPLSVATDRSTNGITRKSSYQKLVTRKPSMRATTPSSLTATAVIPPRLMTAERAKKRSSWREQQQQRAVDIGSSSMARRSMSPLDAYVPDPKNDLDVAVGNIVNDSPFAVKVKMVPGEVGRYWFGKKNPKLAYCRILRSRMVMVRVGGGWVELSQFLRDHALLEEGKFMSTMERMANNDTDTMIDKKKKRYSQPLATDFNTTEKVTNDDKRTLRHSKSTPFQPSSYYCYSIRGQSPISPGIKEGNKFLVTDDDGKQVQVTMTKAKSKRTSSNFRTPWR